MIAWIANHLLDLLPIGRIAPYWYLLVLPDPSQMNQAGPAQAPARAGPVPKPLRTPPDLAQHRHHGGQSLVLLSSYLQGWKFLPGWQVAGVEFKFIPRPQQKNLEF